MLECKVFIRISTMCEGIESFIHLAVFTIDLSKFFPMISKYGSLGKQGPPTPGPGLWIFTRG